MLGVLGVAVFAVALIAYSFPLPTSSATYWSSASATSTPPSNPDATPTSTPIVPPTPVTPTPATPTPNPDATPTSTPPVPPTPVTPTPVTPTPITPTPSPDDTPISTPPVTPTPNPDGNETTTPPVTPTPNPDGNETTTPPVTPTPNPDGNETTTPPVTPTPNPDGNETTTPPVTPTPSPDGNETTTPPVTPTPSPDGNETTTPPVTPTPSPDGNETTTPPVTPTPNPDGNETTTPSVTPTPNPDGNETTTPPVLPPSCPADTATSTPSCPTDTATTTPLWFGQTIAPQTYTAGQPVSVTLPAASGGAAPLSYHLEPALPNGLSFDPDSLSISGAPAGFSPPTLYQLTVTDANGDSISLQFLVEVDAVTPAQSAATVTGVTITSAAPIVDGATAPYAAAANIDVTVTFSGPVTVTGTPQLALAIGSRTRQAAYRSATTTTITFRYAVTGADRDSDGISIATNALTLNGGTIQSSGVDVTLGLGSHALAAQSDHKVDGGGASFDGVASPAYTFEVGILKTVTLPEADAASGSPPYNLAATPALPNGLTFASATRTIAGTPSAAMATTTYTLIANSPQVSDTLPFTLQVVYPAPTVSGVSITSVPASASSYAADENIDVTVTFSHPVNVTGTPQLGLAIGANTRQAQLQSASGSTIGFRYQVADDDVDLDGISIAADALALNGGAIRAATGGMAALLSLGTHALSNSASHSVKDAKPSFGTATIESRQLETNTSITPIVLPAATSGDGSLAYTLTPALPTGITYTTSTRAIAGTPTAAMAATTYTWKATDTDGDSAQRTFSFEVLAPQGPAPTNITVHSSDPDGNYQDGDTLTLKITYPGDMVITGAPYLTLDVGGITRRAFFDSGDSEFDSLQRELLFNYTIQSGDFDGDGIAVAADALRLNGGSILKYGNDAKARLGLGSHAIASGDATSATMRVNDTAPSFGAAAIDNKLYDTNTAITPIVLPEATGGDGALSYTLTPSTMPAGMTWTASTRTIAGTPTTTTPSQTYTWTATDSDGDESELTFSINVWTPSGPAVGDVNVYRLGNADGLFYSDNNKDNYWPTETIRVFVGYKSELTLTGSPQLVMIIGNKRVKAVYDSPTSDYINQLDSTGDPGHLFVFKYVIQTGDWDGDGIAIPADALLLNGGSIRAAGSGLDVQLNLGEHAIASGSAKSGKLKVADTSPSLPSGVTLDDRTIALNQPVTVALVSEINGDSPFTYSITPTLPAGLSVGTPTGNINGVQPDEPYIIGQTGVTSTATYTLRATDRDSDTTTLGTFNLVTAVTAMVDELDILSTPYANSSYGAGEVIEVAVGFDRGITAQDLSDTTLSITIGQNTRSAAYHSTDADNRLVYAYTVQASDADTDGVSIPADSLQLNGATIRDTATTVNAALDLGTHAVANDSSHKVNGSVATAMAVEAVAILSSPASADGYDEGEVIKAKVTFAKPATVTGAPQLALTIGTTQRQAAYQAAESNNDYLIFSYTVATSDKDADGISIAANALALNRGTIRDPASANAALGLGTRAIANASAHKVYTPPRLTGLTILSTPGVNGTYAAGEDILLQLTFSEPVTTHGRPQVALTIGANTRQAVWTSDTTGRGRRNLYQYVVAQDDLDGDGISIASDAINLPTGVRIWGHGFDYAVLSLGTHAVTNDPAHTVRDTLPSFPTIQPQHYIAGTAVDFTLPNSGGDGAITYALAPSTLPGGLTYTTETPTTTTTLRKITGTPTTTTPSRAYTWTATDVDADTAQANFSITVAAANAPKVTAVRIFSNTRAGSGNTYTVESRNPIMVDVQFDQEVNVTGTPQLALELGAQTVQMNNWNGSFAFVDCPGFSCPRSKTTLRFEYYVQAADKDADGISIHSGALTLNGGTITSRGTGPNASPAGIAASLGLGSHAISNDPLHKVDGGSDPAPIVTAVDLPRIPAAVPPSGYRPGDLMRVCVRFNQDLTLTGNPKLALQIGSRTRDADFSFVLRSTPSSPYRGICFDYTFQTDDFDSDGVSILDTLDSNGNVTAHALKLNGATIRNARGTDAALSLGTHAVSNNPEFRVFSPPKITSVSVISTPNQSGTYSWEADLKIAIDYDQAVTFTPDSTNAGMRLTLGVDSGNHDVYVSAADTTGSRIVFKHDVQHTDLDADGITLAANALKLNGGTLRDADGEDAQTALTGFTFTNKSDAKLNGAKAFLWPVFPNNALWVSNPTAGVHSDSYFFSPGGDTPLSWSVTPALPDGLAIQKGTGLFDTLYSLSGTPAQETPLREYTVTVEDAIGVPANGIGGYDLNNGDTDTAKFRMRVTGPRPVVTGVRFAGSPQQGATYGASEEIVVGVSFATDRTEAIIVEGAPELALKIGGSTRQATYYYADTAGSATTLYFRYTVQAADADTDGISIDDDALTIGVQAAIRSARGHNAVTDLGIHAIANNPSHKVNGAISRPPRVIGVLVTSQPARGLHYYRGEEIEIRVEFNQAVGVSGSPTLGMTVSSPTYPVVNVIRQASYGQVGISPRYHYFRYLVQESDVDSDGLYSTINALNIPAGAHIRNALGTDAQNGILRSPILISTHSLNGATNRAAFVRGIRITSRPARGTTYKMGETITAQVRFSKPVTVTGTPSLAIQMSSGIRSASYTRSLRAQETVNLSDPYAYWLEFSYTVQGGNHDADGISIQETLIDSILGSPLPANMHYWLPPLGLDHGATIVGAGDGGAAAQLNARLVETRVELVQVSGGIYRQDRRTVVTDHSLRNQTAHKVNGRQPTVTGIAFPYWPANNNGCNDPLRTTNNLASICDGRRDIVPGYVEGESIYVIVTFSEPVAAAGTQSNPGMALTLESGTVNTTAWSQYSPAFNNYTKLGFVYRVQEGDYDSNGLSISRNALTASGSGSIRSKATGNPAVLTLPSALNNQARHAVLRTAPTPARITSIGFPTSSIRLSRPYANNTYDADEYIEMAAVFNRPVDVTGNPQLSVTIGSNTRAVNYSSSAFGGTILTFRYLVQSTDLDTDGIQLPANAISLNGGAITTRSNSLAADLTSRATPIRSDHKVNGAQNGPPNVTLVDIRTRPLVGNTYGTDETIEVKVHFHKRIVVTGSPQLALTLGTETAQASHISTDDRAITFNYKVKTTDRALNGLSIGASALTLNGGTIKSRSSVNANLSLSRNYITNSQHHRVDGRIKHIPTFGSTVIAAKSWRVNSSVSDTLPAAQGGRGAIAYSISPALPAGLSFNNTTRVISGRPTAAAARRSYTLTARDVHNMSGSISFYITITATPAPTFGAQTISDKTWRENAPITAFTLPQATSGDAPLTYTLSPALPGGVTRNATTRQVSGTPTAAMATTRYTWTATDSDGDTASLTFYITVTAALSGDRIPTFGAQTVTDKTLAQNTPITAFYLPAATGGDGTLTYALSPALPSGVTGATSSPYRVSGTPSVSMTRTQYTWTATDADGDTASLAFHVTITADNAPYFSRLIDNKRWIRGSAITGFMLPTATGGNGALSYSLSPALPAGVTRSATTRQISGTPTTSTTSTPYTWTVEDADGDTASLTFNIEVDAVPSFGDQTIRNKNWGQNLRIAPFDLPEATGGDGALTYQLSPALPAGLTMRTTSTPYRVSGTPESPLPPAQFTWTVTDADGDTASLQFSITIDGIPTFGDQTITDQVWVKGEDISPLTFPLATGGNGELTYTLDPPRPNQMSWEWSADLKRLSGAPPFTMTRSPFTWTVYDEDYDRDQIKFYLTIVEDLFPSFSTTITDKAWTQNYAITPFTLPTATGGDTPLTYSLSPALPAGVATTTTFAVSGTPTGTLTRTEYTWTATDADGDTASLTFDIAIAAPGSGPTFGSQSIADKSWTQNQTITAFTLPAATGGNGALTYAMSPALPGGVATTTTFAVSGAPTGTMTSTEYTWTATDADGHQVSLTFNIEINASAIDSAPTFGDQTIPDQFWTKDKPITPLTLPAATGGNGTLTYDIDPPPPLGMTLSDNRQLSGTPPFTLTGMPFRWFVRDEDGDRATIDFIVTISENVAPTFSTTIANKTWTQNESITPFTLPTATGGNTPLTYTLTPALPTGITRATTTPFTVSGAPTTHQPATTYTWKATDNDGDAAELTFTITIAEDLTPTFNAQTIPNQTWTQNRPISPLTLPTATSGDTPLTYTLTPALPTGTATTTQHSVTGTPTTHQPATTYTWKATDTDGDAVELTFTITITEDLSPSFSTTIADKTWTQNRAITTFTLPTATGGDGSLTYTLSPDLPAGVSKNNSHEVSGTPTTHQTATTYTWKATDTDGDVAQLTFTITITEDLSPEFSTTIPNQTWTQNQAITAFTLPTATGGDTPLTYTLSPALPTGTTKNATHEVSGTPTTHQPATTYTWKATDTDGDATQLTFTITITEDLTPTFGAQTIPNQTWTQNQAITALTLPTATNGDTPLTYTLSPALPAGTTKNASHEISGTPTTHQTATTYTWKATDTDGDAAQLTFTITITEDLSPEFSTTIPNKTWTQNQAITALTLPTATGGDGQLTYTLTPALPTGITKNASHEISGTPTNHQTAATYTWKATDADGDTAQLTFTITIAEDLTPSFGAQTIANQTWTQNQPITAFTLPTATGGDGSLTYTLSPALPTGTTKSATHKVTGTPTNHQPAATYTWKATDTDGDATQLTFTITITEDLSPSFSTTIPNQTWTQNQAITAFTLPTATGGDGSLTHTLSPALPAGTTKNATHKVTGTPTTHQTATTYTWKATDTDGDKAELTFTITIAEDLSPSFSTTIPNQTWTQNQPITAFTLPTATGGDGNLTYTLSPALPAGTTKNASHKVTGTPTTHQTATTYTWKATDTDGDKAELTFTITITEDLSPSFATTIPNQTWTQNQQITGFTLPTATGGDGNLTHTLTPALPTGTTKNASHEVSGTPTTHQTAATYTWKATDADGDTAQLTFTITITEDLSPEFSTTIANQTWTQNQQITAFTLPTATGGDGSLTYTLSPSLPAGVSKNDSHGVTGTPSGHQSETTYTWKATDADGDAAQLTFTITITEDLSPSFSTTIANQTWTQNQQITAFTLPTATNGDTPLTHTLTPALPAGTTKNATHEVSGTPTTHQAAATYTWKATDTDGDAAELTFTITIAEDLSPAFSTTIANQTWTQNQAITTLTLPTATGGDGQLTHTLTPVLPAGTTKNATHEISGTPTTHQTATTYTWKATDADGDEAELTFTITIAEDLSPTFSATIPNQTWTQNQAITAFTLPTATGGDTPLTYTLTPALPAGTTKNASHEVSGTPTTHQTATTYTWKATDTDGDEAQLTFTITIAEDLAPTFGAQTIPNQTWTQNQPITAFTLPTATGGDTPLTYTLTPALPAGTTKNATHRVTGTPTGHQTAATYTWKATDTDGDAAQLTFTIAIAEDLSPTFSTTIANQTWTQNQAITAFTLPTATGGDTPLTYTLTPALPTGTTKNATHKVTGTPTNHQTAATYTWKATDADGDAAQLTFTITIAEDLSPSFGSQTIENKTWTQNQPITAFTLPTATGGDGSLTYTLSPALPAGTTQNATHRVTGTPTSHQTAATYTWKATDADGDKAELTFTITIAEDLSPSFSTTIPNKTWTQNQAITGFTLPTATGGDGSLTYTLSPALPAGVSKDNSHRVTGTPTGHQTATTYTWKATDADGDATQLTFTITIAEDLSPTFNAQTIPNQTWTQNQAITAFTLPTATGGDGNLTYTLSPNLPAGVSKNASHEVSGTPTGHQTAATYTWKATDTDGDTAELTFTITIAEDLSPSFSTTITNQTWTQNQPITAFTLPTATDGDGSLTYTLTPTLPNGLTRNPTTRQISGTPTIHQTATTYTWKATDTDGDAAQLTFTITIAEDLSPTFGAQTIPNQTWTQNQAITAFTLPTATGGDGNLTYTLSPNLPAGVSKNASHEVSGTPTGHQTATTYTWKATDADGDATQLTFTITITEDLSPSFGAQTIPNQTWTQNQAITTLTLPTATGGDGNLTYTLSPNLPTGVSKNASHEVSGTPTGHQTATTYTWKATDADGDTAQLTFTITIAEDLSPTFSTTIANQTWTQNQAITTLTLPTATNGDTPLTYTLTPALPTGTTKNATHEVTGTPTTHQPATTYTWKATDTDGDAAQLTFTITIAEDLSPSFSATIPNKTWTQNRAITTFTLPTATGGDGSLTYTLSPDLPAGVSKNNSHEVSGTPTTHQTAATYTWKATDADGDKAELTFTITIAEDLSPSFSTTIANQTWTQNQQITAFTLPTATGGDGQLTHTLSPALPTGTTKNATHRVTGTPSGHQSETTYTWKATDADGDAAQLTFTITIAEDFAPTFGAQTIPNQTWTQNQPITALTLPTATGGDTPLTYTLGPALPAGTTRATTTPFSVSGTPTTHQTATTYTWKATDTDGDEAQLTFTIAVGALVVPPPPPPPVPDDPLPPSFYDTIEDKSWTQNQAITPFTLPTATGGNTPLTYTLTPALPAGTIKNATHEVSGAPTTHQTATTYTWKATDADGDTAQLTFNITVGALVVPPPPPPPPPVPDDPLPLSFSDPIEAKFWTQNIAITPFTLPQATGGRGTLTYTLSPALPAGVTKNAAHRVTGTPTGHQPATTYTWTAQDADGDTTNLMFSITVDERVPGEISHLSFSDTIEDKFWTQSKVITPFTLPQATGGRGTLTYTLSPALPAGVTINASHRVSGTPSVKLATTEYTCTVRDAAGNTANLTFNITVGALALPPPTPPPPRVPGEIPPLSFSDTTEDKSPTQNIDISTQEEDEPTTPTASAPPEPTPTPAPTPTPTTPEPTPPPATPEPTTPPTVTATPKPTPTPAPTPPTPEPAPPTPAAPTPEPTPAAATPAPTATPEPTLTPTPTPALAPPPVMPPTPDRGITPVWWILLLLLLVATAVALAVKNRKRLGIG